MQLTAKIRGLDLTVGAIDELGTAAAAGAFKGVANALLTAHRAANKLLTVGDHTLEDLARMGHPYATRDPHPPHAEPAIHAQTGRYREALKVTQLKGMVIGGQPTLVGGRMAIEGDEAMEDLDRWLQEGTLTMIARPWMEYIVKTFGPTMLQQIESSIQRAVNRTPLAKGRRPAA